MQAAKARQARQKILALCHAGMGSAELSREAEQLFRRVVPFDRACWHNVDPATSMLTTVYGETAPTDPLLPRLEYGSIDVNQYAALARASSPVGVLSQTTAGEFRSSRRYREVLQPMGIRDELTASFVSGETFWGCMRFYRTRSHGTFDSVEAAFVAALSKPLAEAFRRALVADQAGAASSTSGPGLVLLDARDHIEAISAAAEQLLEEIPDAGRRPAMPLPHAVYAVAARTRAISAGPSSGPSSQARVRIAGSHGWLVLNAMTMHGKPTGRVAVIIERAPAFDVAPLIVEAYGLTGREREVLQHLLRGLSNKEMASAMSLSAYTVSDHLKIIFEKMGVQSRGEAVARVFFDHYFPRLLLGQRPGLNGGFAPEQR